MIQPKPLKLGGTIGIVAPAGPLDSDIVLKGEALLKELGFDVIVAPSCFEKRGYLAGTSDRQRAEDLMIMFSDDDIDAILCMRGGYGCNRIIPYLRKSKFQFSKYPKPLIGYSDITYLHLYLNQFHDLITFHGPMLKDLMAQNMTTTADFFETVMGEYEFVMEDDDQIDYYNRELDPTEGVLVGGNLSIICSTLGTPYEIDTKDKIIFIEEVNEPVYVIDRLMTQLKYSGKLEEAKGIIFGDFNVYDKDDAQKFLKKALRSYKKPVAYGLQCGHCSPNYTILLGSTVRLIPSERKIVFLS